MPEISCLSKLKLKIKYNNNVFVGAQFVTTPR